MPLPAKSVRRTVVFAVVLLAAGVACARRLNELTPFPCADDGTCPSGFTCLAGIGCEAGNANDQSCTNLTGCAEGDCIGGVCLPHCGPPGSICAPGRVCSYPPPGESTPLAHCVIDCATAACPEGFECRAIYGTVKGCVTKAATASLDKLCEKAEDCQRKYGTTYLPITCSRGSCTPFCATLPAVPCADPARTCNVESEPLRSGCLVDCSDAGVTCPDGLTCKASTASATSACVNPAAP